MRIRQLGKSGLRVSATGLGCNNFGGRIGFDASRAVVHAALDAGITLFDTADVYGDRGGSETVLGKILGDRRKDVVLATKFGAPMDDGGKLSGASRHHILSAVEASLKRLKTDWIDLYQVHKPDAVTPIEETLRALDDLVRSGKIRYIGASNFAGWQLIDAQWTAKHLNLNAFISHQDEYSLLERKIEVDLIPAARTQGIGLLPYFPLASGLLSGKYKHGEAFPTDTRLAPGGLFADRTLSEDNWRVTGTLQDFVASRGRSLLELAFSWLLIQGASSVIAGATQPDQVVANATAGDWALTAGELAEVDRLTRRA
jgi:aryl-alcohol dehydrogenase-like predicted oxidoreductase